MLRARLSTDTRRNPSIRAVPEKKQESNGAWLTRVSNELDSATPKVLLLGGTSVSDFRVRIAQSHARGDMKPSFWSHVGVVLPSKAKSGPAIWHAPLEVDPSDPPVAERNAIVRSRSKFCDDAELFPNVALLQFPGASASTISAMVRTLKMARLSVDLVTPLVDWLGFVWGASAHGNPLLTGVPLPSAAMAEAAFGGAGIDLTPGLADRTSCPEAIWQAALWWTSFYAGDDGAAPSGCYLVRQEAAAVADE